MTNRETGPTGVILASTSRYRASLLERLAVPFDKKAPDIDEAQKPGETAEQLASRLAREKCLAVARSAVDHLVIGSDQVATVNGEVLGKPGDFDTAVAQLQRLSGQTVTFVTALCGSFDKKVWEYVDRTLVTFRRLEDGEIRRYIEAEKPLDCAGSFKSEGLGISLFDQVQSDDPTALVGIPLIATARLLRQCGIAVP